MYEKYFGLVEHPFRMSPSPDYLMMTQGHREALAGLAYGILSNKGLIVLVGDAGTGKTTVLKQALRTLPIKVSFIVNPSVEPVEFLELAMSGFGITDIPSSKSGRLIQFEEFLSSAAESGDSSLLVVDEAQLLPVATLEELRMLTNLETEGRRMLQIVLSGQHELRTILNRQDLRQIKQRIALRLTLKPLENADEVGRYMAHRWARAGGGKLPFEPEAVEAVAFCSSGIPRVVNAICDNALLSAFAQGANMISEAIVAEVATELDLRAPSSPRPIIAQRDSDGGLATRTNGKPHAGRLGDSWDLAQPSPMPTIERYKDAPSNKQSRLRSWMNLLRK